jgi:thiol-disulfide isomerase/thioredoxin
MPVNKVYSVFGLMLLGLALSVASVFAAGTALQDAITDYNHGQYAVGLKKFLILEKQASSSAMAHYYAALCEQNLNQTSEAKSEYEWILANGNATLKNYAQKGIDNLGRRSASNRGGSMAPVIARAVAPTAPAASAPSRDGGVKRILEFSTSWCGVCKAVAPIVEETKSKLPGVQFDNLDAEDSQNAALVAKYQVTAYPTFVFLDRSGNTLLRKVGGPRNADGFVRTIQAYSQ